MPDRPQIVASTSVVGGSSTAPSLGVIRPVTRASAASITAWNSGPAPVTPDEPISGERSKLPTHTPTVTWRDEPTVQLS